MKKITRFMVLAVLICSLLAGCASVNPNTKTDETGYLPGTRTTTEYTSEWIGLKYTLNNNMVMATDDETNNMMGLGLDMLYEDPETGQQLLDYSKIVIVFEMVANNIIDSSAINILAEKLMFATITEEQYIMATKNQLEQMDATVTYNDVRKRIICGIEFSEFSYVIELDGYRVNLMLLVKKIDDRMVVITLGYSDQTSLDTLLAGFSAY